MFTRDELMELQRALTVYIDWCAGQPTMRGGVDFTQVFADKIDGAERMRDDIDAVLYPED